MGINRKKKSNQAGYRVSSRCKHNYPIPAGLLQSDKKGK